MPWDNLASRIDMVGGRAQLINSMRTIGKAHDGRLAECLAGDFATTLLGVRAGWLREYGGSRLLLTGLVMLAIGWLKIC